MPGKMARSRDQTSFGTAGTPEALRSPPMGFPGTPPSAIVQPVPEFIWEMSAISSRIGSRRAYLRPSPSGVRSGIPPAAWAGSLKVRSLQASRPSGPISWIAAVAPGAMLCSTTAPGPTTSSRPVPTTIASAPTMS